MVILLVPVFLLLLGAGAWLLFRKTFRTRYAMAKQLRDDPDINDWLVVFNWSRKVLYFPTVMASLVAFVIMLLEPSQAVAETVGGCWLAVFFVNFLIDEYEMSIKVLMIVMLCLLVLFLWLMFLDWLMPFLRLFKRLHVSMSAAGYLMITMIFVLAVLVSWIRGLFYYVAITPNYMNVQAGPTETSEQISREEFSTRIDTGDFLERLLGFGRLIVTFSDQRRQPIVLLVSRIGDRVKRLDSVRGKLSFDRYQPGKEDQGRD